MRFDRLQDWLDWQSGLHLAEIDLGLERIGAVAARMSLPRPAPRVVTVAGTNGKGSSVAMLEAILLAAGRCVGVYTSPHLLRYTERVRISGREAMEEDFCASFARIDEAREDISLTYFEFGTLAAIDIIAAAGVDVAILEVGLGGRLDAVNLIDADVALITALDIDHCDWLGPDRETIAREKAGIMRAGAAAVCADPAPPRAIAEKAASVGARLYQAGRDFHFECRGASWSWTGADRTIDDLPAPALPGAHQYYNAAGVLMALSALDIEACDPGAIRTGLQNCRIPGRFQRMRHGVAEVILDVCHNPQAVRALAEVLDQTPCGGRTLAVFGMLADKDVGLAADIMSGVVDVWYCGGLDVARGLSRDALRARLSLGGDLFEAHWHDSIGQALHRALSDAEAGDRVVVLGSFYTVAEALEVLAGGSESNAS
ncbi:MAG: bifunctional tetrahydrofolate synthase/dihydrofolate synthase [Gammaproteobacteria bacterium]|nr:bifunctional tetrahydrofolate synthase/dihydrofolate synthase [Gammaproteobacteria bacterium]